MLSVKKLLFGVLLFASSALATERQIMNPESNGDLTLKANVGGTPTTVITVDGTNGYAKVKGITTNGAACSGCIGENVVSSQITNTTLGTSDTDVTGASVALPSAGAWMLFYSIDVEADNSSATSDRTLCNISITTAANGAVTGSGTRVGSKNEAAVAAAMNTRAASAVIVNISTATTYKLRGNRQDLAGTGSCQALIGNGSSFFGVRIY